MRKFTLMAMCLAVAASWAGSAWAIDLRTVFQEYTVKPGSFSFATNSRIVLSANDQVLKRQLELPGGWAEKLRFATGLKLEIVVGGAAGPNDVLMTNLPDSSFYQAVNSKKLVLTSDTKTASKLLGDNILDEGYQFAAGPQGLVIKYDHQTGGLRAFQTLTQLVMNDGKPVGEHRSVAGVTALDYPLFADRQIFIDVARLFIPADQLIGFMEKMSLFKLNELHLGLSNTATPPGGTKDVGYFRLYSPNRPELMPPDKKYYTQADWDRMEAAAARYGIKIIPEFNTPGHALAWLQANPDLPKNGNSIDISTRPAFVADYIFGVISEFRPWFKSGIFHMGTDEYEGSQEDEIRYINQLYVKLATGNGNPAKAFSEVRAYVFQDSGFFAGVNKNIVLDNWNDNAFRDPAVKWLDLVRPYYYFVPKLGLYGFTRDGLDPETSFKFFQQSLADYAETGVIPNGLYMSNWNDVSSKFGLSTDYINAGMARSFPYLGLYAWRGPVKDSKGVDVPILDLKVDSQIPMSQEITSYWVRKAFSQLTAKAAFDQLMSNSSHRRIDTSGDPSDDHLVNGDQASDWMAWDIQDMAKALAVAPK